MIPMYRTAMTRWDIDPNRTVRWKRRTARAREYQPALPPKHCPAESFSIGICRTSQTCSSTRYEANLAPEPATTQIGRIIRLVRRHPCIHCEAAPCEHQIRAEKVPDIQRAANGRHDPRSREQVPAYASATSEEQAPRPTLGAVVSPGPVRLVVEVAGRLLAALVRQNRSADNTVAFRRLVQDPHARPLLPQHPAPTTA